MAYYAKDPDTARTLISIFAAFLLAIVAALSFYEEPCVTDMECMSQHGWDGGPAPISIIAR